MPEFAFFTLWWLMIGESVGRIWVWSGGCWREVHCAVLDVGGWVFDERIGMLGKRGPPQARNNQPAPAWGGSGQFFYAAGGNLCVNMPGCLPRV